MATPNLNYDIPADLEAAATWGDKVQDAFDKIDEAAFITVKSRGAQGDNSTDDTAAIQQAVNDIQVGVFGAGTGPAQVVYFAPGIYKISDTITVSAKGGAMLLGSSRSGASTQGSVIQMGLTAANANKDMLHLLDGGLAIVNFVLQHTNTAFAGTGHIIKMGSATVNCSGVLMRDVRFVAAPQDAIRMYRVGDTIIRDCGFESNVVCIGIREPSGANRIVNTVIISGCNFFASDYGLWATYGEHVILNDNLFNAMTGGGHAVFLQGSAQYFSISDNNAWDMANPFFINVNQPGISAHHSITGNTLEDCRGGILLDVNFCAVANNQLVNGNRTAAGDDAIAVTGSRNKIDHNFINNGWRYGINPNTGLSNWIRGNTAINCTQSINQTAGNFYIDNDTDTATTFDRLGRPTVVSSLRLAGASAPDILGGFGPPGAGLGSNKDLYFNFDGGISGSALYQKRAGAWVAVTTS